jgi:hypothetical protein
LPDISTTATGLLCWRDSHPLEWQLASLHQIVPWSTLCRADRVPNDPVLTTRGWLLRHYAQFPPARPCGSKRASREYVWLMGRARGGDCGVDQPMITGRTHPAPDARSFGSSPSSRSHRAEHRRDFLPAFAPTMMCGCPPANLTPPKKSHRFFLRQFSVLACA